MLPMMFRLPPLRVSAELPRRLFVGVALLSLTSSVAPGLTIMPPTATTFCLPAWLKLTVPALITRPRPVEAPIATVCAVVKFKVPAPYLSIWNGETLMALLRLVVPSPRKVMRRPPVLSMPPVRFKVEPASVPIVASKTVAITPA